MRTRRDARKRTGSGNMYQEYIELDDAILDYVGRERETTMMGMNGGGRWMNSKNTVDEQQLTAPGYPPTQLVANLDSVYYLETMPVDFEVESGPSHEEQHPRDDAAENSSVVNAAPMAPEEEPASR